MAWTTLCALEDLREGEGKYVEIDGHQLAVFLVEGTVHVTDNRCPHAGGSMSGGYVEDRCAICPWHGWAFELDTGKLRGGFGDDEVLAIFPSRVLNEDQRNWVQADLPMP